MLICSRDSNGAGLVGLCEGSTSWGVGDVEWVSTDAREIIIVLTVP